MAKWPMAIMSTLCIMFQGCDDVTVTMIEQAESAPTAVFSEFPVPPGAKDVERGKTGGISLTATVSQGDPAFVQKFYGDYLDENGWILFKTFSHWFSDTRFYRRGKETITVSVMKMGGDLYIQVNDLSHDDETIAPESLAAATTKVPLPPSATATRLDLDGSDDSFSLNADVRKVTADEVLGFYRNYFEANYWRDLLADQQLPGMLEFGKGLERASISVKALEGGTALRVYYEAYAHTREEFDRLVHDTATPEASALIQRMAGAYGALKSYADTGTHESIHDGEVLSNATFKTHYVAPDKLRFEYSDSLTDQFHTEFVLSKLGDTVQTASSIGAMPEISGDISMAIASLYGVTSATSGNIPELLLGMGNTNLVHLTEMTLLEEAKADDGSLCTRLHGKDFLGRPRTIWIGKDDLMIRKIESVEDEKNREITTYSPRINVDISDADLEFKKPKTSLGT